VRGGDWRRRGDQVEPARRAVRQMEDRIRELERQLGRKTLEVEILKGP
jgi:transposase